MPRRVITAALAVALMGGSAGGYQASWQKESKTALDQVQLVNAQPREPGWRQERCRFQTVREPSWTDGEVIKTIRCAVEHFPVDGGLEKALAVAACESGFEAVTSGPHLGVYQFAEGTWDESWTRFLDWAQKWKLNASALNGRSNVLIAIKVVHQGSWAPWSCA